jgi:hypothetical protein
VAPAQGHQLAAAQPALEQEEQGGQRLVSLLLGRRDEGGHLSRIAEDARIAVRLDFGLLRAPLLRARLVRQPLAEGPHRIAVWVHAPFDAREAEHARNRDEVVDAGLSRAREGRPHAMQVGHAQIAE